MAERSCGSCSLCCKTMGVDDMVPVKPRHEWCPHCVKGNGCAIYASRPTTCRDFRCLWLQSDIFPDDHRPDRTGVVLVAEGDGTSIIAHCDPARPTAWRSPKMLSVLSSNAAAGNRSGATAGGRFWIIGSRGDWEVPSDQMTREPNGRFNIDIPEAICRRIGFMGVRA